MAFWSWSKTAASNATADGTINYAEGQAPSSINDSARAAMARTAEWRDDISGTITTGGTSTAYTVTSNQVFDTLAHMNGAMIAFVPHATNGATVTLNVDSLGAKALRLSPSVELQSGVLILGTPYVATYVNADSSWYLQGAMGNPYGIPLGGMMPYIGSTAPNSAFVIPIGQAISRTTYATLFTLTSTTYGVGDGSTTFNVPDLRGRAVFGQESGGSGRITNANSGIVGTTLGATGGDERLHQHNHAITDPGHQHTYIVRNNVTTASPGASVNIWQTDNNAGTTSVVTTGITVNNSGGGSSQNMPPAIILPYILRVI